MSSIQYPQLVPIHLIEDDPERLAWCQEWLNSELRRVRAAIEKLEDPATSTPRQEPEAGKILAEDIVSQNGDIDKADVVERFISLHDRAYMVIHGSDPPAPCQN